MSLEASKITGGLKSLDPRMRVLQAVALSVVIAVLNNTYAALFSLFIALLFSQLLQIRFKDILPRLAAVNVFILFLWLLLPFSLPGEALFRIGPFALTGAGLKLALLISIKANAIMIVFLSFVCPLSVPQITNALSELKIPPKLCHLLGFTFRFIFVLEEERRKLLRAAKNRGFQPGSNMHTYKTYAYIIGMVLVRSWERAERVQQAMLCRGFSGKYPILQVSSFKRGDIWLWVGVGVTIALIVALEAGGLQV
jgi:cobalt/nickel transport system permease protein